MSPDDAARESCPCHSDQRSIVGGCVLVVCAPNRIVSSSILLAASVAVDFGMSAGGVATAVGRRDLTPPSTWRPVEPLTWRVPGVALAAWAGPDGSSLVVYRTLPAPGGTAAMIAEAWETGWRICPGCGSTSSEPRPWPARRRASRGGGAGSRRRNGPQRDRTPTAPAGKTLIPSARSPSASFGPAKRSISPGTCRNHPTPGSRPKSTQPSNRSASHPAENGNIPILILLFDKRLIQ